MHAVRRPGSLHEFYRRLLAGKGAQKAKVALARKLSKAVFWMLSRAGHTGRWGHVSLPRGRRARAPTWPVAKARVVTLQPASHTGHVVLGQGRRVSLGGPCRKASGGPKGDGRAVLRDLTRPLPLEMCYHLNTPPLHSAQVGLAEDELEITHGIGNGHSRHPSTERLLQTAGS
jgi:hypothetical protein